MLFAAVGSIVSRQNRNSKTNPSSRAERAPLSAKRAAAQRPRQAPAEPHEASVHPSARLKMIGGAIFLASMAVGVRLYCLQGSGCDRWIKLAARQQESSIRVQGARGTVLDSSGRALAVSVRANAIGAHTETIQNKPAVARSVATLTGEKYSEVIGKLQSDKPFVWLARGLGDEAVGKIKQAALPGIVAAPEFKRVYPQGVVAGNILGRVDRDGKGLAGIELGFNGLLSASNMKLTVRRDARGKLLPASPSAEDNEGMLSRIPDLLFSSAVAHASNRAEQDEAFVRNEGGSLMLSIDARVQEILEQELATGKAAAKAHMAYGLLMDAESGEILAMSQNPQFNPNQQDNVSPQLLKNSVLQDSFEPGSTLKPLVAALALDANAVQPTTMMNCENGQYHIGSHVIRDVHPSGILSFGDVLVRSSNICMAKMGAKMGKTHLYEGLASLGFGAPSAVELPGESRGIFRNVKDWADIDTMTHSYGQGISVTAVQLVRAYSALANDGLLVQPTLLKRADGAKPKYARVFTPQTAKIVSDILKGVTEDEHGTGTEAALPNVTVRGKTGTAQKARTDGRAGYDPDAILASFIGYVDGSEIGLQRKLILFVAMDEPEVKPRWGGVVAAPVFRAAMERILSHLLTMNPVQSASIPLHPSMS